MSDRIYKFADCWSHPNRLLSSHHSGVAALMYDEACRNLGQQSNVPILAKLIGLFHDLGKATWYFQDGRLREKRIPMRNLGNHANLSALLCFDALEAATREWESRDENQVLYLLVAIMVIRRHHGALKDLAKMVDGMRTETEELQLAALDIEGIASYIKESLSEVEINHYEFRIPTQEEISRSYRRKIRRLRQQLNESHFVLAGQLFSLLVWADKIDAATGGNIPHLPRIPLDENIVTSYCEKHFPENGSEVSKIRTHVRKSVEDTLLSSESRIFTLTAPTGSGKTIAILNAAIKLRRKLSTENVMPRIIYCLPFTSIIDQNYSVISELFASVGLPVTDDLLLKHHHLAENAYVDQDETDFGYHVGQLLTTAWESEVVVTTFIQLLNSIIGNQNKMMRKIFRIPNSIILLDEVQAIPRKFWETIEAVLIAYANLYECRFVLLTATKPVIIDVAHTVELLPDHAEVFAKFDRYNINLRCESGIPFSEFKKEIEQSIRLNPRKRTLIVMNTVQSSIELFEYLSSALSDIFDVDAFTYLSTNITPRDRKQRIEKIRNCSKSGVIVSTQVIEAGVDISVDIVHRDLAPLDSIIQSAGRCNRSGERPSKGQVYVWNIQKDENDWQFAFIYPRLLLDATQQVLAKFGGNAIPETKVLQLAEEYFKLAKCRLADSLIHECVASLEFEGVHDQFKLIEDNSAKDSFFVDVESDPQASDLWKEYQAVHECEDIQERRMRLNEIRSAFYERVVSVRLPYGAQPTPGIQRITDDPNLGDYYDRLIGFKGAGLAIF